MRKRNTHRRKEVDLCHATCATDPFAGQATSIHILTQFMERENSIANSVENHSRPCQILIAIGVQCMIRFGITSAAPKPSFQVQIIADIERGCIAYLSPSQRSTCS
mmetsp:Transcript_3961/g.7647  ORF Transcript_3961/g.7647 Transcript_3961/m.7647 type:complete len:106 (-) Transcript_3961:205-522(-)